GPFIQYTHARIQSVLRKAEEQGLKAEATAETAAKLSDKELYLIRLIDSFPETVKDAAEGFSPAIIANYIYELAKEFNQFYHDYSILKETDEALRNFRLLLASTTGRVIRTGMDLLGVR